MARIKLSVGRQRATGQSPAEAGYTRAMQGQMNTIAKNLDNVIRGIEGVTPKALEYGVKPIFDESQVLVPKDTGKLRTSGFIESRRTSRFGASVAVGYGKGNSPDYAAIVHENMSFHHVAPTQSKYLEEAVNRHIAEVGPRVVDFIQRQTGVTI